MIRSERLLASPIEEGDLEKLRQMRNDYTTWHWLTDINPISAQQQRVWFEKLSIDNNRMYLTIKDSGGRFIGILRSDEWDRTNRSVRVGLDIAPECRGQGYGTEALGMLVNYMFKNQNMHRVWLLVAEGNETAIKLYRKLGFKEEGRLRDALFRDGLYHDYISMSILDTEWKK